MKFQLGKFKDVFGGAAMRSSPKTKRPIDTKSATHLVLRSSKGILRLPKTIRIVNEEIYRVLEKYDFTLYKYSNNSNHLHILLRVTNRYRWKAFIRELTGRIAQEVREKVGGDFQFWLGRPFTRIIKGWGRNYERVKLYIELNIIEATRKFTREEARAFQNLAKEYG